MDNGRIYARAFGIGVVAGMRSMTAPAIASAGLRNGRSAGLAALALGEMVVDKLPFVPSRTMIPSLIIRAGSGAFAASTLAKDHGDRRVAAAIGAAGAIAGSFAFETLRKRAVSGTGIPDPIIALVEDALAFGAGSVLR